MGLLPRVFWRAAVALLCLAACVAGAEDEVPENVGRVAKKAAEMPRIASSADGFVEIVAADVPGDSMGFRLPLLRFTTQLVGEIEHAYGLAMPRADGAGLVIHALDGQTNDVRVIARSGRRDDGRLVTRIYLPSPGFSSIEALRLEIVQAYLREMNSDGRYHLILNDAVLLNKTAGYDITNEVIEGLNARYQK